MTIWNVMVSLIEIFRITPADYQCIVDIEMLVDKCSIAFFKQTNNLFRLTYRFFRQGCFYFL